MTQALRHFGLQLMSAVIGQVVNAGCAYNVELVLGSVSMEPVEGHICGFGLLLLHDAIVDGVCCGAIGGDGCGWLRMTKFD